MIRETLLHGEANVVINQYKAFGVGQVFGKRAAIG